VTPAAGTERSVSADFSARVEGSHDAKPDPTSLAAGLLQGAIQVVPAHA
jgi:hypothetical protein